jgi:hypothetical protein
VSPDIEIRGGRGERPPRPRLARPRLGPFKRLAALLMAKQALAADLATVTKERDELRRLVVFLRRREMAKQDYRPGGVVPRG